MFFVFRIEKFKKEFGLFWSQNERFVVGSNMRLCLLLFQNLFGATQTACYVLFSHTANWEWNTHLYMHSFNRARRISVFRFYSHQTKMIVSRKYMGAACVTHTYAAHTHTHNAVSMRVAHEYVQCRRPKPTHNRRTICWFCGKFERLWFYFHFSHPENRD